MHTGQVWPWDTFSWMIVFDLKIVMTKAGWIPESGPGGIGAGSDPVYMKFEHKMVRYREASRIPESDPGGLGAEGDQLI